MPEFTGHAAGVPIWVDLSTPDLGASTRFYSGLFGWDSQDLGEETGHYTMFTKGGKMVAAATPAQGDNHPSVWTTYVQTDDLDATVSAAGEKGGSVLVPGMDVMSSGRMAVISDPTGAVIALWQPGDHRGVELANEPGTLTWNELATRDIEKAVAFYTAVFGWTTETMATGDGAYHIFQVDGRGIAGGMQMGDQHPAQVPPHWLVYFATDDLEGSVATVEELGGSTTVPPTEIPNMGRFAVVADATGAPFALWVVAAGQDGAS